MIPIALLFLSILVIILGLFVDGFQIMLFHGIFSFLFSIGVMCIAYTEYRTEMKSKNKSEE